MLEYVERVMIVRTKRRHIYLVYCLTMGASTSVAAICGCDEQRCKQQIIDLVSYQAHLATLFSYLLLAFSAYKPSKQLQPEE